jgi:hypothetical protein
MPINAPSKSAKPVSRLATAARESAPKKLMPKYATAISAPLRVAVRLQDLVHRCGEVDT